MRTHAAHSLAVAVGIGCGALLAPTGRAQPAAFQALGVLPGDVSSQALGVSDDGAVVVGFSDAGGGPEAFRWTAGGGLQGLGFLPGGVLSVAGGASADGAVVGGASSSGSGAPMEAFRWTAGAMQGSGHIPNSFNTEGTTVSADGSTVVGYSTIVIDGLNHAFRWMDGGAPQDLGVLVGGTESRANDVSADGGVVVGFSSGLAFRWTQTSGMVSLGSLPGGSFSSAAGVSNDGSVIVGVGVGGNGLNEAFRWTQVDGPVGLGTLPGATASQAFAVSADGAVVAGRSSGLAFVWSADGGMRDVKAVLVSAGLDLTGWTLSTATGLSTDGAVVVGYGTNPQGQNEGWRAVLGGQVAAEPGPGAPAMTLQAPVPNPAASRTTVRFVLVAAGLVRLSVHDALGREVALLVNAERPAGVYEATLDASRLAPGAYVVHLAAPAGVAARRFAVLR